ncbi:MAG TPA: hypothetical protein VFY29_17575, partial [Terriglobia bacterium]|nr:hypothetical protein [Terriglobia bacterium]
MKDYSAQPCGPGRLGRLARQWISIACALLLMPGNAIFLTAQQPTQQTTERNAAIPPDQMDSLVAPIALYPDPLLSQTL